MIYSSQCRIFVFIISACVHLRSRLQATSLEIIYEIMLMITSILLSYEQRRNINDRDRTNITLIRR